MIIRLLALCALTVACSGRNMPPDGPRESVDGGAVVDASVALDASSLDAGPDCVSGDQACSDEQMGSQTQPCMPWEEDCERRQLCSDRSVHWCRPAGSCLAAPSCPLGAQQTDYPCGPNESDCSIQTMCGIYLFCRPLVNCAAVPSCEDDDEASRTPCGLNETQCLRASECGATVWCREGPSCDSIPECSRGVATDYPCAANEPYCEPSTICAKTRFCRF